MMMPLESDNKIIIKYVNYAKKLMIYALRGQEVTKITEINLKNGCKYGWKLLLSLYSYSLPKSSDNDIIKLFGYVTVGVTNPNSNIGIMRDTWVFDADDFGALITSLIRENKRIKKALRELLDNILMQLS